MRFLNFRGVAFSVRPLTQGIARTHAEQLVWLHNHIPNQSWTADQLLSDRDDERAFRGKWEISQIAQAQDGTIVGLCIGFEREADDRHYFRNCIYMHRMAVDPGWRGTGTGALLHAQT